MARDTSIWDLPPLISDTANEATVEVQLIAPLLAALGYSDSDISAKHPVRFQQGRVGRPAEADFAVFDGVARELDNCLFVVEAKRPNEKFGTAQVQAESYAMYLRALVYIVTDGISFDVWQYRVTGRSELILKCKVSELAASRAKIEALLTRTNLKTYRNKLREPSIHEVATDISAYEKAELARIERNPATIIRTLSKAQVACPDERTFTCDDVLDVSIPGAVIYGSSGMGKSSVCHRLHRLTLLRRQIASGSRLSIEIFLPDLARVDQGVAEFAFERISAHCPGLTRAIFNELLLNHGADFFCDAFDRVAEGSRQALETDLNLLLRDSPRSRIFVFSRSTSPLKVAVPSFYLQPLSFDEQRCLQQVLYAREGSELQAGLSDVVALLSPFLARIANSPLVFSKIVGFYISNHKLPTELVELFDFWLGEALRHNEHSPTAYDTLVKALTVVATATWDGPATVSDIVKAFDNERLPSTVLDALVGLGAVIHSMRNIEMEHEALADFLRARYTLARLSSDEHASITASRLDRDAFFPVLLVSMTTDAEMQRAMLTQFSPVGLPGYIDAVRYRGKSIPDLRQLTHDAVTAHVMAEIADGFSAPARIFFPSLLSAIIEIETGERSAEVTAVGSVGADYTSIDFLLKGGGGEMPRQGSLHGQSQRDIPNEGRLIGMELLHKALDTIIANADLVGGVVWHEERLISRLRLLLHEGFDVEQSLELAEQTAFWEKYRGSRIQGVSSYRSYGFSVDDILVDLDELRRSGMERLTVWWAPNSKIEWWKSNWDKSDAAIEHYYLRADAAYEEVVQTNFSLVAVDFREFQVMPREWEIFVSSRNSPFRTVDLKALWHPVATKADVNVSVRRDYVDGKTREETERWFDATATKLSLLGRRFTSISYSSGLAPSFDGASLVGRFDGKTAVLREVCARLRDEFNSLFKGVERFPLHTPPFE